MFKSVLGPSGGQELHSSKDELLIRFCALLQNIDKQNAATIDRMRIHN
ncbi:MAG TPA: hypothetical protein PKD51_01115 [Saprospiraceae bacterium]|nr:hypothetical protein [Saprospiraceae bacterium]